MLNKQKLEETYLVINTRRDNVKVWRRKANIAKYIAVQVYKVVKSLKPIIKFDPIYNAELQKYNGRNLPTKHKIKLSFKVTNIDGND